MITITKILVPTDFSNVSVPAIGYAISLAKDHGAEVMVVHAVPSDKLNDGFFPGRYIAVGLVMPPNGPTIPASQSSNLEHALRTSKLLLHNFLEQKIGPEILKTVKITPLVRLGGVVKEIIATAKEDQCDLIVMTSRGRSLLRHLFAGSFTERVVRRAPCPVLSIQPSAAVRTEKNERVSVKLMEKAGVAF